MHEGDTEPGHDRGRVKRPHIDRGGARAARNRRNRHTQRHRQGRTDPRNQQRTRHGGDGEDRERQPDQQPDLSLRHMQFVVHERNHRRHDQERHAHGDAGDKQQAKRPCEAADLGAVLV